MRSTLKLVNPLPDVTKVGFELDQNVVVNLELFAVLPAVELKVVRPFGAHAVQLGRAPKPFLDRQCPGHNARDNWHKNSKPRRRRLDRRAHAEGELDQGRNVLQNRGPVNSVAFNYLRHARPVMAAMVSQTWWFWEMTVVLFLLESICYEGIWRDTCPPRWHDEQVRVWLSERRLGFPEMRKSPRQVQS